MSRKKGQIVVDHVLSRSNSIKTKRRRRANMGMGPGQKGFVLNWCDILANKATRYNVRKPIQVDVNIEGKAMTRDPTCHTKSCSKKQGIRRLERCRESRAKKTYQWQQFFVGVAPTHRHPRCNSSPNGSFSLKSQWDWSGGLECTNANPSCNFEGPGSGSKPTGQVHGKSLDPL